MYRVCRFTRFYDVDNTQEEDGLTDALNKAAKGGWQLEHILPQYRIWPEDTKNEDIGVNPGALVGPFFVFKAYPGVTPDERALDRFDAEPDAPSGPHTVY